MAESEAGMSVGQDASLRALASVTDAVRVATEASLAPVAKSAPRREAKTGMQAAPLRTARPQPPRQTPEIGEAVAAELDPLRRPASGAETVALQIETATASTALPEPPEAPVVSPPSLAAPDAVPTQRTMETIMTSAEDLMSFQQGNFEAMLKSSQIWATGLQDLGRHWAASAQAQMDETMGTVKAMTAVKSLREAVELQSTIARTSMEKVVAEGGKITDATMKLAEQTLAPITARLNLAADRFGRTAG